ncbi:RrF2 family transcriptional regulator [Anditalea andensis]|uniref:Rrf2 family transcriptional regulator n=1 Tax=Anditalea andensis TaxID=1048983 RepID=A0A074L3R2_9BACT|nr:Rrf2 family transcriptional regulator [Anditalea andensis]KEO75819.1 hypothetical protein EL17_22615 [Anditalea andensis]
MVSRRCEYGIRASILIARESLKGNRINLRLISDKIGSPLGYTTKILQSLSNEGILLSRRGPKGGFEIAPEAMETINFHGIIMALDGGQIYSSCGLGLSECSEDHPCPIHEHFNLVRADLNAMVKKANLLQLAHGLINGKTFLNTSKKNTLIKDKKV